MTEGNIWYYYILLYNMQIISFPSTFLNVNIKWENKTKMRHILCEEFLVSLYRYKFHKENLFQFLRSQGFAEAP